MPINSRPIHKNDDDAWTPIDLFAEPTSHDIQKPASKDDDAWTVIDLFAEPEKPSGRTIGGTIKDIGVSVAKGVVGLGEAAVGLTDIPTFGIVGKTMEGYLGYDPKKTQEFLSGFYSPEQKKAFGEVEQAVGFLGTIKESLKHPSTIGHAAVESFPLMLGGAAAARGLLAIGMKSPLLAGAIGEGIVSAGAAAEQTRQQTEDGLLTAKQALIPALSGAGTAMFSLVGGRVAQKLGLVDVDTFLAGGSNVTKTGIVKRIIGGGISEGAFEELPQSMQEQVWLNAALDKPLMEGVSEAGATGMLAGAAMGAGFNIFTGRVDEAPPTARDELLEDYEKDATAKEILTGKKEDKLARAEALEAEEAAAVFEEPPAKPKEEAIADDKEREGRLARIEREREEPGRPIPEPVTGREEVEAGRILQKKAADETREIKPKVVEKESIKFVGTRETAKGEFPIFEDKSGFQVDYKSAEHEISNVAEYETAKPRFAIEPKVEKPKVAEKEPWEMTFEETWEEMSGREFNKYAQKVIPDKYEWYEKHPSTDAKVRHEDLYETIIKQAISEGKPVPKEVLAEYPDLAPAKPITPKPPKPTPPEAAEKEIKAKPISEVGEISPKLLEKRKALEGKIESLRSRIDQAEKTAMPGTFVTGRENVPRSRIRKLEAQLDKRIDSAVEYEKLKKELTQIENQIETQEEAPKRELVKEKVKAKLEEQFDTIKVGDQIDVGGNNILTVTKKNPKSVITEAGGKWTSDEIINVIKKPIPEVEPKPIKAAVPKPTMQEKAAKPKVEKKQEPAKPTAITVPKQQPGFAWIKGKQKPILSARLIERGKDKGKYEVVLTKGRDADDNIIPGLKRVVEEKAIITMPEEIKPYGKPTKKEIEVKERFIPQQEHAQKYVPITRKEADDLVDKGASDLVARFNVRGPETTGEEGYYMRQPVQKKQIGYDKKEYLKYSGEIIDAYIQYRKRHGKTESAVSITEGMPDQQDRRLPTGVRDEKQFAAKATKPQGTITRQDLQGIFGKMKNLRTGVNPAGNFYFKVEGKPAVEILEVDHISGFIQVQKGTDKERIPVGSYLRDTIELKTGGKGFTADINTAFHEYMHFLEKNGIVTANDIKALDGAIGKAEVTEEDRATYVGDRLADWKAQKNTRIKRILKKISDFANAVYEFFSRTRTAKGVLRDIASGEILAEKKEAVVGINQFAQDVSFSIKEAVKKITDNPNFVKWFGNSKVVGEDGEPLTVYHGTRNEFESFKKEEIGGNFAADERGFFFISRKSIAQNYADSDTTGMPQRGGRLVEAYISLQKPLVIDSKFLKKEGMSPIGTTEDVVSFWDVYQGLILEWSDKAKSDGVILIDSENGDKMVVAFEPTQIKSIYNTGAFGITEPDIMYQMAGQKAIGAPTGALLKAQDMLAGGKSKKDVWKETGWLQGAEGEWKFEIDDSGANLLQDVSKKSHGDNTKLSKLLEHDTLFEAYPVLKNMVIRFRSMRQEFGSLRKNPATGESEIYLDPRGHAKALENLHHEIQHAIQEIEGFARGGMPGVALSRTALKDIALIESYKEAIEHYDKTKEGIKVDAEIAKWLSENPDYTDKQLQIEDNRLREKYKGYANVADALKEIQRQNKLPVNAIEAYKRLAGEIEARDAATRAKLTPEQRREQIPYEAEGIPEDQWIITKGDGTSFSVEEGKVFQTKGPTYAETQEPVTEEDWIANRKVKKDIKLTLLTNVKRVASEIAEGVDKYLGVISTRLGNVSPKLKNKLRQLDFDINTNHAEDVKAVEPLLRKAIKMEKNDIIDWDYARKNSVVEKINELVVKYGMQKEYAAYRDTLDKVREEGIDVGLDIGEIEEYAPRILKDQRGFLKAINKPEYRPLYTDRLKKRAADLDMTVEAMPLDMKADIISNIILGGWSGLGGVPATRQRVLKKIPAELNKFYADSDAALMQHLYSMRKAIEARRFFGKIPKKVAEMRRRLYNAQTLIRALNSNLAGKLSKGQLKELARLEKSIKSGKLDEKQLAKARRTVKALKNIATDTMPDEQISTIKKNRSRYIGLEREYTAYIAKYGAQRDYTQNIGAYIVELIDKGEIDAQHEGIVNDILNARFHEKGTRGIIQAYKNMSYIDTMGSPISALTQIGDFAWPAYLYGVPATLKHAYGAAIKKSKITQADVGIQRIAQEFADSGTLGNAVSKVFKMVGLEKIDSIAAETLLNAALEDYQGQAKNNPAKLKKEIRVIFEAETNSVIEDLVSDGISYNVKLLVYHKLLDHQPKALSETPQKYLSAGNGRIFYMLKTFTIKQFDIFRRISYNKIVKGDKAEKIEGLKNLVKMSMFFVLANAGADELKDWALGRKTDFDDRVVDNMLRLFGVSKFVTWKARTEGVGSALARQILPPFKFIDSAGKDIITFGDEKGLEVIGSIPVAGKLAYWHMGRGLSKREDLWDRRLRKQKAKLNKTKDRLDTAKNKMEFRRKYHSELLELKRINKLQGRLNKKRKRINELKSLTETVERKKQIQRLEVARTDMIKNFLGKE